MENQKGTLVPIFGLFQLQHNLQEWKDTGFSEDKKIHDSQSIPSQQI